MLTSISGRSVIVTGASKGIGKGIARVFASKGAHVLLVARNLDLVEAAACEIRSIGGIAHAVAADVSCMEDTVQMAKVAVECYGGIDILCCNAGVFPSAIPQRRLGSVEDVAYAALFLASDEAAFISGQTIVVDGGQVLPESQMALDDL